MVSTCIIIIIVFIFIFYSFVCFFSFWNILFRWKLFLKSFVNHFFRYLFFYVLLTAVGLMAAHYYTLVCPLSLSLPQFICFSYSYEHPYLLADNRHYTFYIWKNIYRRNEQMKYFLTPIYSISIILIVTLISKEL